MTCLLCGAEADQEEMHHLGFNLRNRNEFERRFPNADLDLALEEVGFCAECMLLSKSERAAMILVANQHMLGKTTPHRTLH